jgi:hypothetical protein
VDVCGRGNDLTLLKIGESLSRGGYGVFCLTRREGRNTGDFTEVMQHISKERPRPGAK